MTKTLRCQSTWLPRICSTFFLETAPRFLSEELPPFLTANVLQVARPRHSDSQVQRPKVSCAFHA